VFPSQRLNVHLVSAPPTMLPGLPAQSFYHAALRLNLKWSLDSQPRASIMLLYDFTVNGHRRRMPGEVNVQWPRGLDAPAEAWRPLRSLTLLFELCCPCVVYRMQLLGIMRLER
jgi:hypothetical protein